MKTSIAFTGDIGFDKYMEGQWSNGGLLSPEILGFLKSADHVAVNVEGPIVDADIEQSNEGTAQLIHAMPKGAADLLCDIKADIWNICNNHIMDAGPAGIKSTLDIAAQRGVMTLGAGMDIAEARRPVIVNEAGGIGMIGVGYQRACRAAGEDKAGCYSWSDLDSIADSIAEIKKSCRWCIIVAHAGEEFTPLPSPYTRERYHKYLEMGADIVVAHHPHVPMNYEKVGDKMIFYSLGNFIFDTDYQRSQFNTQYGIVIKLNFTEESFDCEAMGIEIKRDRPRVVKAALPRIFTHVGSEDYALLAPLSAKVLVAATKRQLKYLDPKKFENADEETWQENFTQPLRSGRVPGETLDFFIICPLAAEAEKGEWKKSTLEGVKEYMLEQL